MGNFFKSKIFKGTALLTIFGFIGKALSAIFKISLIYIVGSYGVGIYQLVLPIMVFFIVFASDGFSLGLTIKTAEDKTARVGYFNFALKLTLIVGFLSAVLISVLGGFLSKLQGEQINQDIYYIVSLGVVIISILSVVKAEIRGREQFKLFSIIEILEDFLKVVFGLIFGLILMPYGVEIAIIGVFCGIVLSSFLTLIVLMIFRKKNNKEIVVSLSLKEKLNFVKFSIIAVGAGLVVPAIHFIESAIVIKLLGFAGESVLEATKLYGISRGSVSAILNLPFFVLSSFEVLLLPNLARSKNNGIYYKKTKAGLTLAIFVSVPFVLLFSIFAPLVVEAIYQFSLSEAELMVASNLLRLGAVGVLFSSISLILTVILNSNNNVSANLISVVIAGAIKILFMVFFVPKLSIYGVELSSVLFSMVYCLGLIIFAIKKQFFSRPKMSFFIILGWIFIFLMVGGVYFLIKPIIKIELLACCLSFIAVGTVVLMMWIIWYLKAKNRCLNFTKKLFGLE